jgi:hypothetical protein
VKERIKVTYGWFFEHSWGFDVSKVFTHPLTAHVFYNQWCGAKNSPLGELPFDLQNSVIFGTLFQSENGKKYFLAYKADGWKNGFEFSYAVDPI